MNAFKLSPVFSVEFKTDLNDFTLSDEIHSDTYRLLQPA